MKTKRFLLLFLVFGILLVTCVFGIIAQEPIALPEPTAAATLVFEADLSDLRPCGDYKNMRHFHNPEPVVATPTNMPDANAATPTQSPPTSTPRPAPSEDRVGFPANYETEFKLLFILNRPDRRLLRVICGNSVAAQWQLGEPFAYGSVLMMISYSAQLDANRQPVLDENGDYIGENLVSVHVQRKEAGFGEAYGADRAGEWEFMVYNRDGSVQTPPQNTNFCAVCHSGEAGASVDNAFRMHIFYEGDSALIAPPVGENEISIYLYNFHEPVLTVKAGTTVTWINHDEATHDVVEAVLDDTGHYVRADEPLFESGILASVNLDAGDSFSFTFDKPGEYLYRCTIHENMTGRIIVTE